MMIKSRWLILLFALVVCLSTSSAMAGGDANVILGQKTLTEGQFDDLGVDGQPEIGVAVTLDFQWPVALAIDLLSTHDDRTSTDAAAVPGTTRTKVETLELDIGVRKFWEIKKWRPYVGGGLSMIQLDTKQTRTPSPFTAEIPLGSGNFEVFTPDPDILIDDDDSGIGFWLAGGTLWTLPEGFNVGAELRYSDADGDLTSEQFNTKQSFDAGGFHLAVMLGYHW